MVQKKVLLDSCSYFRLALNIHPLLFVEFGDDSYCLYVIEDMTKEYTLNPRLKSRFDWVTQKKYIENRKHPISISKQQRLEIKNSLDLIWGMYKDEGVSYIDVKAVVTAMALKVILVSDDAGVIDLSKEFEVECYGSLELMKLMHDKGFIDMEDIKKTVAYWLYTDDLPNSNFHSDYKKIFGEDAPTEDYCPD